jgi:hypothetical protein
MQPTMGRALIRASTRLMGGTLIAGRVVGAALERLL